MGFHQKLAMTTWMEKIVDSSGKCHKMVADGEFYVGLTLEKAAVQYRMILQLVVYQRMEPVQFPDGVALVRDARMKRTQNCSSTL